VARDLELAGYLFGIAELTDETQARAFAGIEALKSGQFFVGHRRGSNATPFGSGRVLTLAAARLLWLGLAQ
jgi:hypothetical protein